VVIIPVFTTRSNVTGLSKHSEPALVFVQPHGIASDLDHPRALDTSQTLEFARISEVALLTSLTNSRADDAQSPMH